MTLWFVFALMTVAAIFAVLWPLGRGGRPHSDGSEAAVYKDQLAEIDRDLAAGLIGSSEAEAARVEIGRRLLAAADNQRDPPAVSSVRLRRAAAVIALVGLPVVAVALYLPLGSPQLGDFPLAERIRAPDRQPAARKSGGAGRGASGEKSDRWPRLERAGAGAGEARPLRRCGRRPIAIRSPITATVPNAGPISAKLLAAAAGGVVTSEAKAEFERAVALDADEAKANYFLGLAAEQDGRERGGSNDLACDAGKGAGRTRRGVPLVAGCTGPGRRFRRSCRCQMTRWPRPKT